jgi:thiosulfate/3-mercaptopyruvate sulfurtransferase
MKGLLNRIGFIGLFFLTVSITPFASANSSLIVETDEVAKILGKPDIIIIDGRDKEEYDKSHIPGAINIPKETFRAPEDIIYKSRHGFLTSPEKTEKVFGGIGIDENTRVIVYGTNAFPNSTIVFAVLKQYGHENVQVMRGEIEKWVKEGRPLTKEVPVPKNRSFKARPNQKLVATKDWIIKNKGKVVIIDMRSFGEYTGLESAGNRREGHISGAHPVEWKELSGKETVKSNEEMFSVLKNNGVPLDREKEYITYCNWGVGRGTAGFFYLKVLGFENVRVYGGSMEEWSGDSTLPVTTPELLGLE